jgi:hypothetical protein
MAESHTEIRLLLAHARMEWASSHTDRAGSLVSRYAQECVRPDSKDPHQDVVESLEHLIATAQDMLRAVKKKIH